MNFVGRVDGELKIISNIEASQLPGLTKDFCWIDVDGIDPATQLVMKNLFGISSIDESGNPTITQYENYDLILINYYYQKTRRELQVMLTDKLFITVHAGSDPLCDEVTASLGQMIMSGGFSAEGILSGLFEAVVRFDAEQLKVVQESLRNLESQIHTGMNETRRVFQVTKEVEGIGRVLYDTQVQLGDLISYNLPIKGIKDSSQLTYFYGKIRTLSKIADDQKDILARYNSEFISQMWGIAAGGRHLSMGLALLALFVALASLFYVASQRLIPNLPIDPLLVSAGIMVSGIICIVATQKKIKFRVST